MGQNLYDDIKLFIWHKYFLKNIYNVRLIFVSDWIFQQFKKEVKIEEIELKGHAVIISNSIGEFFEKKKYCPSNLSYDFITIRNNLDDSKYGVDIIMDVERKFPQYRFCLIGKGKFFEYFDKPENVEWINGKMTHDDLMKYINLSKYARLPTREDTQGLMACELVSCGIPLITSNIDVCKEVFCDCLEVELIDNDRPDIEGAIHRLAEKQSKRKEWDRYYAKNTILKEIAFIKDYYKERI